MFYCDSGEYQKILPFNDQLLFFVIFYSRREDDKENKDYDQVSYDCKDSSEDSEGRDRCQSDYNHEKQYKRWNYQDNEMNNDDSYNTGNRSKSERRKYKSDSDDEHNDYRYRNRSDKRKKYRDDDNDDGQYRESERNRWSEYDDDDHVSRDRDRTDKRRRDGKDDYKDRERYSKRRRENEEDKRERERKHGYSERWRRDDRDSEGREDDTRKRMEGRKEEKILQEQDKDKDKNLDPETSKAGETDKGRKKVNPDNPLATRTGVFTLINKIITDYNLHYFRMIVMHVRLIICNNNA